MPLGTQLKQASYFTLVYLKTLVAKNPMFVKLHYFVVDTVNILIQTFMEIELK